MITVWLLGDSIRENYQDEVIKLLGADYDVYAPEENCRFSAYTFNNLRNWMPKFPAPDIIHWNNGLWDVAKHYGDGCFAPIDIYLHYMERIYQELKKTGAKIILATTTPLKKDISGVRVNVRENSDIIEYNKKLIERIGENIIINDLYSLVYPKRNKYICDDLVHLSVAGKVACGQAVADKIRAAITEDGK